MRRGWGGRFLAACLALSVLAALAPGASAVLVHGSRGRLLGVSLRRGVNATAVRGSVARAPAATGSPRTSAGSQSRAPAAFGGDNGNVVSQGGPVVHSGAPYVVSWVPSGESIPASWEALAAQYFSDVTADSTKSSNAFGVLRQYSDGSGFAGYRQAFSASSQVITDTHAYPPRDFSCTGSTVTAYCISDTQLQDEIARLITADGLPTDGATSASSLPQNAPMYFVVLPSNVDVCLSDGSGECASNAFCAYHGSYADGADDVVYAAIPIEPAQSDPKACQEDGYITTQMPNGSPADVVLNDIGHEDSEALTDPLGSGWYDPGSGNEVGDNCAAYGPVDFAKGTDPYAFSPTLGGTASSGTLYDQVIDSHDYYLQSEWSNGDTNCEMQPTSGSINDRFTVPSGMGAVGSSLSFNPSGSSSSQPYTSVTWNFGDGQSSFSAGSAGPATTSHKYSSAGIYTVTLTLVDDRGNVATTSHQVTLADEPPTASFTPNPTGARPNQSVSPSPTARIMKLAVKANRTGATMLVSVNSAGTLTVGRRTFRLRHAGTAKLPIPLTPAQLAKVVRTHRLTIHLALRFIPVAGPQTAKTASVTFHPARGGHLWAVVSERAPNR